MHTPFGIMPLLTGRPCRSQTAVGTASLARGVPMPDVWFLMKLNDIRDKNIFEQIKAGTKIRYLDYGQFVQTMLTNMEQDKLQFA